MITTQAWVLYKGRDGGHSGQAGADEFRKEAFLFPDITDGEVLVEPIYGSWEGNMTHALTRDPIDVCHQRGEEKVVLGNAGVVRVLKTGRSVTVAREGDLCLVFGNAISDESGYMKKAFGYDAPQTVGILAKQTKIPEKLLIPIPSNTQHSLQQWAAFGVRYITAWDNWKAAYGTFQALTDEESPAPVVWGWGGGATLAELQLARRSGCRTFMIASDDARLRLIQKLGIQPIDRRPFRHLNFDEKRYQSDPVFKKTYQEAEETFLNIVRKETQGRGVSIFVDYIGVPVLRATLKALACPGVITTAGWKSGMKVSMIRAMECMNWHSHVHTHYSRYGRGAAAVQFAETTGWMPPFNNHVWSWDDIPQLAEDYAGQRTSTYFPLFQVNPL
jgi:NADPH:quinone reductase-like Zn-dependent oxidoreductase